MSQRGFDGIGVVLRVLAKWLVVAVMVGTGAGLVTSKILWNYYWRPPSVEIDSGARPLSVSLFRLDSEALLVSRGERDELLQREFSRCRENTGDCTFGRVLLQIGEDNWVKLDMVPVEQVQETVETVLGTQSGLVIAQRGVALGVVANVAEAEEESLIIGLDSNEIQNDTYGHAEFLVARTRSNIRVLQQVYYYYDVAGIEFATPWFLVASGTLVTSVVIGAATIWVLAVRWLSRTRRGATR